MIRANISQRGSSSDLDVTFEGDIANGWPEIIPLPERGDMGEAEPYRIDLLPEAIQKAAREVSRFSMVPATSPAVIGLSVLAAAIGKKAVIVEREGLEHYPALFNALIAYSGERKSPPFKIMTYPLEQWAEDQQESHKALTREAKATNEMIDVQAAVLKNRAKKEGTNLERMTGELAGLEAKRIQPPPFPSMFTTDTTEQRLFQKLHDRGGAYAVMSGEGRPVLDAIMGKYLNTG
jgi:putative DNA primase/helicase